MSDSIRVQRKLDIIKVRGFFGAITELYRLKVRECFTWKRNLESQEIAECSQ